MPTSTKWYLRDSSNSGVSIASNDVRYLDSAAGAGVVAYVKNTVAGAVTPPTTSTQWTKTAGGSVITWVTDQLNAVTFSSGGVITFNVWAKESATQANATITAELLRLDASGNVLSTVAACTLNRAELTTTIAAQNFSVTLASAVSLNVGDRLAVRCHLDDGSGTTMASGRNCTLDIEGGTTGADGDSYVTLPAAITSLTAVSSALDIDFDTVAFIGSALDADYEAAASVSAVGSQPVESAAPVSTAGSHPFEATGAPASTAYTNPTGSGARYELVEITTDLSQGGTQSAIFDGTYGNSYWWGGSQSGKYFQFNFMEPRLVTEIKWYQDRVGSQGTWKVQGSTDGVTYTDIGTSFNLGATLTTTIDLSANATAYQYYKMVQLSGTTQSSPYIQEVEFKIDAPNPATTPTYTHSLSSGNRSASITVSSDATMWGGTVQNLVNGGFANNSTDAFSFNTGQSGKQVKFQFPSALIITEAKWIENSAGSQGTWKWQGSNDNSTWTDIGNAFTLGATAIAHHTELNVNTTAYIYYRLLQTSGTTSSGPWIQEVYFKIQTGSGSGTTSVSALLVVAHEAVALMQSARSHSYQSVAALQTAALYSIESTQALLAQITQQYEAVQGLLLQAQDSFESSASAIGTEGTAWESLAIGAVGQTAATPMESVGVILTSVLSAYESLASLLQSRLESWESLATAVKSQPDQYESLGDLIAALVSAYESQANNAVATPVSVSYEAVASLIVALTGAHESQSPVAANIVAPLEALQAAQLALSTAVEAAGLVVAITGSGHEALAALSAQQTVSSESLLGLSQQIDSAIEALSDLVASTEIPWAIAPSSIIPSFVLTALSVSLAMLAQAADVLAAVQAETIEAGVLRSAEYISVSPVMTFESLTIEPIEEIDSVSIELETGVDLIDVLPDDEE